MLPKRAFTLLELLVVISIMIILVVLAFPTSARFLEMSRSAKCLGNLKQLAAAAINYSNEHDGRLVPMYAGTVEDLPNSRVWRGLLLPYLDGDGRVMVCPSDTFEVKRTVGASTARVGTQPTSYGMNSTFYYNVNGLTLPLPGFHDYGTNAPGRRISSIPNPASTIFLCDIGSPDSVAFPLSKWTEKNRRTTQASFGYARMPNSWAAGDFCVFPRHGGSRANAAFYDGHVRSVDIARELVDHPIGDPECLFDYH